MLVKTIPIDREACNLPAAEKRSNESFSIRKIRRLFPLLVVLVIACPVRAQEPKPGLVVEKVVCLNDSSQSYALYLPSNYSPDRKWPILYALDAGARGALPVARFKAAAEKYGYIVAGSNNSQNGPVNIVKEALGALITDTESRFSLDSRRTYMAGFSGGARVAVAAGMAMKGKVAGVIGCGAGFPASIQPSASLTFAFFGAVGLEDFNFPELRSLDDALEKLGVAHKLEIFKGGHEWPPESVCTRAIEWMEIQAMKSGVTALDAGRIDAMFSRAVAEAQSCENRQEIYEAYQRYSSLAKDFAGLKDIHAFEIKAADLGKSQEVRKAANDEAAIGERQARYEKQLGDLLAGATGGSDRALQAQELIRSFINLRQMARQTKNEADRLVAQRVLTLFWIRLNELSSMDFENKEYARAALHLGLMAEIRPENPGVYYHLSRACALRGDKKAALKALNNAVSRGYDNASDLQENPDFQAVRGDPAFQGILSTLQNKRPSSSE